jgi:predicted RNase H-like nuclease (RuvC/YqgF family)
VKEDAKLANAPAAQAEAVTSEARQEASVAALLERCKRSEEQVMRLEAYATVLTEEVASSKAAHEALCGARRQIADLEAQVAALSTNVENATAELEAAKCVPRELAALRVRLCLKHTHTHIFFVGCWAKSW